MPSLILVEIYSRPGCHLCDDAKAAVLKARPRFSFDLSVIDIDRDPALVEAYGTEIPVVAIDGEVVFKITVDEKELRRRLERLCNP